jgi:transcriptional regulator with XRE-family HTH domain
MDINDAAGKRIRMLRRTLGISQSELAKKINLTYQQLQKYETGKNRISIETLEKISDVLQTSSAQILTDAKLDAGAEYLEEGQNINEPNHSDYLLLRYMAAIKDSKIKKSISELVKNISLNSLQKS